MKSPSQIFIIILSIIFLMANVSVAAQTKEDVASLRQEIFHSIQTNSYGYQKFLDYYSKISVPEMLVLKIKAQLIREDYSNAVITLFQLRKTLDNGEKNDVILFQCYWMGYQINHSLGIESEAVGFKNQIKKSNQKLDKKLTVELSVDFSHIDFFSPKEKVRLLDETLKQYIKEKNYFLAGRIYYYLGNIYLSEGNTQLAEINFQKSYKVYSENNISASSQIYPQTGLAKTYLLQKKYAEAYDILIPLKAIITSSPDVSLQKEYYEDLALISVYLNNSTEVKWADGMLENRKRLTEDSKFKGRALLINKLDGQYEEQIKKQKLFWNTIFYTVAAAFSFLIIGVFVFKRIKSKKYLETKQEADPKIFNIPDKTEKELLHKLDIFESSGKYTQKNLSLKTLSQQLETNPRYLSEIVNKHKNANFSTYINELRIDYILKKLKDEPDYRKYKVGYLAEESGFSSHSLFTTVFKNRVGKSPIEYIQDLEK